ncbi:MAG: FHA domain-containing protein [Planctomycetota bacterium]|nr:MAG: FHA domain-containing protein [Planctomycetota bacterium]
MPSVRILNGPNRNQTFVLRGGEMVGRDPSNRIQVFAPGVSRRHFKFGVENGRFYVEDLGSSNGTYVNNIRITKHPLSERDTITVGGINLLYSDSNAPDGADGLAPNLQFSSEDVNVGAFGLNPAGFGSSPAPEERETTIPVRPQRPAVALRDDDEDEAAEDYSLDASIVFDATTFAPSLGTSEKVAALQKRLSLLFEISQELGSAVDLDSVLEKIMDKLFGVFPQADRGFILLGDSVETLRPVVARTRQGSPPGGEVQISKTIARKVLTEKQAILSQNAMEDDRFSGNMSILNFRILSIACTPLLFRDEVYGLIQLDTQDRSKKFDSEDLNLLASIAAQASIFVKNIRLFDKVAKEAEARANLQRYFSPALADKVASGEIDLKLGGDMKSGTVFFSDIIGFTSMSEKMSATEVVRKINRYMKYMVDIVFKYQGSVDKFIGDCIMAVWGAPISLPDEAVAAVTAAVEMQNALFLFNGELMAEGSQPIHMGIGLNSGQFVAGNMGTERRMEYTVIGDNVNLAQRVESKAGRGMVLVTDATYERCEHKALAVKLRPVALKGKAGETVTYCIRGVQQPSSSGTVYMTTLPMAVNQWSEDCERGLLVKVKLLSEDKALGLVLFHRDPGRGILRLESYAPELPRFVVPFEAQGQVKIQAAHGLCLKGVLDLAGTPFAELFRRRLVESEKSPEDMPRSLTPA